MTLGELKELVDEAIDMADESTPVHIATQPSYPLLSRLATAQLWEDEEDGEQSFLLSEGDQIGYGSREMF